MRPGLYGDDRRDSVKHAGKTTWLSFYPINTSTKGSNTARTSRQSRRLPKRSSEALSGVHVCGDGFTCVLALFGGLPLLSYKGPMIADKPIANQSRPKTSTPARGLRGTCDQLIREPGPGLWDAPRAKLPSRPTVMVSSDFSPSLILSTTTEGDSPPLAATSTTAARM